MEQGGEREVAEGPEREYAGHTLDYTRAAMDGWERRGIDELQNSVKQMIPKENNGIITFVSFMQEGVTDATILLL